MNDIQEILDYDPEPAKAIQHLIDTKVKEAFEAGKKKGYNRGRRIRAEALNRIKELSAERSSPTKELKKLGGEK